MNINEKKLFDLIGNRIKKRRDFLGITQEAVARDLQVTRTSLSNIEKGKQKPPLHLIYQICFVLDLAIDELFPPLDEVTPEFAYTQKIKVGGKEKIVPRRVAQFINRI